jgi:prephenate dehydrogenase
MAGELIDLLGGHLIEMEASEHDKAVALISHLPQIAASLVAKQLLTGSQEWLALSGGGVRDTTRIASSDPELWKEIIAANSQALLPILSSLRADLDGLIASLDEQDAIADVIAKGQEGRARIPGKHGGVSREYTHLPIVIEDKPGQLAALFEECAEAGVNVEDLSIEHSPGQFTGLITLALSHEDAGTLATHLQSRGWNVHSPK